MIPDFYKGKQILASDFTSLANEVKSNRITSVVGGTFQRGIHGTTIIIPQQTTQSQSQQLDDTEFPFRLFAAEDSVKINLNSFLLKDATGDTVTISNLEEFYCIPSIGQEIILEITIDSFGVPSTAMLKCGSWQDIWPTYTNPVVRDPQTKQQNKLIVSIGECSSADDDRYGFLFGSDPENQVKVIQMINMDLCCFMTQLRGLPAVLAMPWGRHNQIA